MPIGNNFRHQLYTDQRPAVPFGFLSPPWSAELDEGAATRESSDAGRRWTDAGVQAVYLVHGTFTGEDAWGLTTELERLEPAWSELLRQQGKAWVDHLMGDVGNYSESYAQRLQQWLSGSDSSPSVRRFHWSGENNHTGRALAALELLDELLRGVDEGRKHVVLWGHSHAGNVFALMTNLLASDSDAVRRFFAIFRPRIAEAVGGPSRARSWNRVRRRLLAADRERPGLELDIVTFGTPIRYGWETRGYRRLLHFVHHRPAPDLPDYRVPLPATWFDLRDARYGDYIQQLGVAGTDFLPSLFAWRHWRIECQLARLLAPGLRPWDTIDRLRIGQRVPDEGETLLVDYPPDPLDRRELLLGHAIYTSRSWLAYHADEVTKRFYGDSPGGA